MILPLLMGAMPGGASVPMFSIDETSLWLGIALGVGFSIFLMLLARHIFK